MARLIQPRSYDCVIQEWIEVAIYGKDRKFNDEGHYGRRMSVGNGGQILSYRHFEMARVLYDRKGEPRAILVNGERASNTTTKHQGYVRAAVNRCGLPSAIIPYGALEAAGVDLSSIHFLHTEPDKWLEIKHESERPPRHLEYVKAREYTTGDWSEEEVRRWNDWHDWSDHQTYKDRLRQNIEYGLDAWTKLADSSRTRDYWVEKLPRNYQMLMDLEESGPTCIGEPSGHGIGRTWRPSPPTKLVPTGNIVEGYASVNGWRISGSDADGIDRVGIREGVELHHPDDDGMWRWTTRRHILGESLISADVRATRRVKCPDCGGAGWDKRGKHPNLPHGMVWTGERYQPDWSDLMVRQEILVPVPRTDVDVYQYPGQPEHRRQVLIANEYRQGRSWMRWTEPVMGALPLPRDAYDCRMCRGSGKVTQNIMRRGVKFLSGFDHGEPHLAYFFCELPKCDATTVAEAYEALKPDAVKLAESMGRQVKRQGDIFAIPVTTTTAELKRGAKRYGKRTPPKHRTVVKRDKMLQPTLFGGHGRPISEKERVEISEQERADMRAASMLLGTNHQGTEVIHHKDGTIYARGCLWHVPDGRTNDHVRVKLGKQWHIIVKNTVPVRRAR